MIPATIVAVEGPDKVGKATQSKMLVDSLEASGYKAICVEVPIKSAFTYRIIYAMLKSGSAKRFPNLFQFVQFMNKFTFQVFKLWWMRFVYHYIVFDRWKTSTNVYGKVTNVSSWAAGIIDSLLRGADVTLVLLGKNFNKGDGDSYESDSRLQERVAKLYALVSLVDDDAVAIDNRGDREIVHKRIINLLRSRNML